MVKSVDGTVNVEKTFEMSDESDLTHNEFKSKRSHMNMDSSLEVSSTNEVIHCTTTIYAKQTSIFMSWMWSCSSV